MAAPTQSGSNATLPQDTLITIKVSVNDSLKKLKLPLRDLGANVLPEKLRQLLAIKPEQIVVFERFSDSAGGYITLDPKNPQVFKTLIRAAKAKLKLRLKATVSLTMEQQQTPALPVLMNEGTSAKQAREPLIVRTPGSTRDSTAYDRRSVGSGIFQFKEARASQQTLVDTSEAPAPRPFSTNNKFLSPVDKEMNLAFRGKEQPAAPTAKMTHAWSVYCNKCDQSVDDAHFHCSICDNGDYDLCPDCVSQGHLCPGEGHWLIKRFMEDGKVINSTTERISPRKIVKTEEPEIKKEIPGAFTEDTKTLADVPRYATPTRTCNSCVVILPDREFVTCEACDDFDLCIKCHTANKHGHHPGHTFHHATEDTVMPLSAEPMLAAGRNVAHNAICDNCDKKIYGVRHKCLDCPDWDYCNDCHRNAVRTHPRHRFTAIYTPIGDAFPCNVRHFGIYCDGPLCSDRAHQSYITGVRYKCAVCHDTDFCASCEALPTHTHNRTHPLIKFKTPVRGVSIETSNEDNGTVRKMGDRHASVSSTVAEKNAAGPVQTVAEIAPSSAPVDIPNAKPAFSNNMLTARFVKDTCPDGTVLEPGKRFTQIFTMRNDGPHAWPAGCSVRHIGGDNMLNVDNDRPAAVSDIKNATESNVIGRDIAVGEEVAFKIVLKSPTREGKHISYWRMKAADGTPFGHRLWVDIEVKKPVAAVPVSLPNTMPPMYQQTIPQQYQQVMAMRKQQQQQLQLAAQQQKMAAQLQQQQQPQVPAQFQQMAAQQPHQQMMVQQQQELMQQQQSRQALHAKLQQAQAQAQAQQAARAIPPPAPPAYETLSNGTTNISARIAAMREQQAKRREQLMSQFNATREEKAQRDTSTPQSMQPTASMPASPQPQPTEEDKMRKDAARQRVEHIKAKILRAREEKAKGLEAKKKSSAEESEKVKKILEEVAKNAEAEREAELEKEKERSSEGSQMVFPKLDKESPASSTYQSVSSGKGKAAYVENEDGQVESEATPSVVSAAPAVESPVVEREQFADGFSDEEDFEEIEVLSADGEESGSDDGFLTDEEWDVLDAEDRESEKGA